jgi:hypothetical protein
VYSPEFKTETPALIEEPARLRKENKALRNASD